MKRFILALLMALVPSFAQIPEIEPNNRYNQATVVQASPATCVGSAWPDGDQDYWRFVVAGYGPIKAVLTPPPGVAQYLLLYNQMGKIVAQSHLNADGNPEIWFQNPSPFSFYYYVVVRSPAGVSSPDDYTLALTWF